MVRKKGKKQEAFLGVELFLGNTRSPYQKHDERLYLGFILDIAREYMDENKKFKKMTPSAYSSHDGGIFGGCNLMSMELLVDKKKVSQVTVSRIIGIDGKEDRYFIKSIPYSEKDLHDFQRGAQRRLRQFFGRMER